MPSNLVREFYQSESFAILGMSRKKKNFSWSIYKAMSKLGKPIYPVHPDGGVYNDVQFYDSLNNIDKTPEAVIISLDLEKSDEPIEEINNAGIRKIWFQQGSYKDTHLKKARGLGLEPLTGCVLMYMPGTSLLHRFHGFLNDKFSKG